jgi:hypothetical protein
MAPIYHKSGEGGARNIPGKGKARGDDPEKLRLVKRPYDVINNGLKLKNLFEEGVRHG